VRNPGYWVWMTRLALGWAAIPRGMQLLMSRGRGLSPSRFQHREPKFSFVWHGGLSEESERGPEQ